MRAAWFVLLSIGCGSSSSSPSTSAPAPVTWSYTDDLGPARWGALDGAFAACGKGARQSPIDLPGALAAASAQPPTISYPHVPLTVTNTGHAIQVDVHAPGTLTLDGRAFTLAQFHVHMPSEHTVGGQRFDGELHFVNKSGNDIVALGVFLKKGAENATLAALVDGAPHDKGEHATSTELDVQSLVPKTLHLARYDGSLTIPPCTETVTWLVELPDAGVIELSPAQLEKLSAAAHGPNSRPLQDVHGRAVAEIK